MILACDEPQFAGALRDNSQNNANHQSVKEQEEEEEQEEKEEEEEEEEGKLETTDETRKCKLIS